jgi:hypothetical protein
MTTERHNAAGQEILKAILRGSRGAWIAAADVGTMPASGMGIPRTLADMGTTTTSMSRPDLVLKVPTSGETQGAYEYICVEIKYCCDYLPDTQRERAEAQHRAFNERLAAKTQCTVRPVIILLGVSGTIYDDLLMTARAHLGLTGPAARDLGTRLNKLAVRWLSSIYATRSSLEKSTLNHQPPPRITPPTKRRRQQDEQPHPAAQRKITRSIVRRRLGGRLDGRERVEERDAAHKRPRPAEDGNLAAATFSKRRKLLERLLPPP